MSVTSHVKPYSLTPGVYYYCVNDAGQVVYTLEKRTWKVLEKCPWKLCIFRRLKWKTSSNGISPSLRLLLLT